MTLQQEAAEQTRTKSQEFGFGKQAASYKQPGENRSSEIVLSFGSPPSTIDFTPIWKNSITNATTFINTLITTT